MSKPFILLSLLSITLVALTVASTYWKFSPFISLHSVEKAVGAKNAPQFGSFVDYQRLRESLTRQLQAQVVRDTRAIGGEKKDVGAVVNGLVDVALRPEVLMLALSTGSSNVLFRGPIDGATLSEADSQADDFSGWKIEHTDPNILRAYATTEGKKRTQGLSFVFARKGYAEWRIVDLIVPSSQPIPLLRSSTVAAGGPKS